MTSFLEQIFTPEAFKEGFNLANLESMKFLELPDSFKRDDFVQFVDTLAEQSESPEWLGLPSSAELLIRAGA